MKTPLVSVIVLNWNGQQFLRACLESLQRTEYENIEFIVVDNASTDGSENIVKDFPAMRLVQNAHNSGYAAGNNFGFTFAQGDYIVALNNDIVVEPDWLNDPIALMETDKKIAITGCRQMRLENKNIIDGLFKAILHDLRTTAVGNNLPWDSYFSSFVTGFVVGINGGSAVYRTSFLKETKGFDERFFGYYEDDDLCFQAFLNGWKTVFVSTSMVYHLGSASFKRDMFRYYYLLERNRLLFIYKNFPLSLIFRQFFFLLLYEIRNLRGTLFGLGYPTLYIKSRFDALRMFKALSSERKQNIRKFKQHKKYFFDLFRQKLIPYRK